MVLAIYAFSLVFAALVLGGTAYVVFGLGYSGWWFLLALIVCAMNRAEIDVKTARVRALSEHEGK
jgi:hypothetical protein